MFEFLKPKRVKVFYNSGDAIEDKKSDPTDTEFVDFAQWVVKHRRSVFNDADISHESKVKIAHRLGYSDDIIDKP